ncbi:hypothetical protein LPB86_06250 [Pedobacter sp. MC2016-14]|uniref:hypothetical protein n=1 Tax=Pedobacter sp. MC2016-14 TaxID=2897327 RepID=UPI001E3C6911|nr:hypothetical protein [Pedobacter sp. MC2016-14]MCD0487820.1 hypothetical protein [Pedobacter sp. MC2016-14]
MNPTCKYTTKTINYAIVNLVDWMTATYAACAWSLALKKELAYLKAYTSPVTMHNITYDELDILDELEDDHVNMLLDIIYITHEYLETLLLLYAVDREAAYVDDEAIDLASKLLSEFMPSEEIGEESMEDVYFLVPCTINLWYVVAIVVMEGGYDFVNDKRGHDFLNDYFGCKYDEFQKQFDKDDKKVELLVSLIDNITDLLLN